MKRKEILSGIRLSLRTYEGPGRLVLWMCALSVVMRVVQPFLGILMPKIVLDQIEKGVSSRQFMLVVGGMALALTLVGFVKALTDQMSNEAVGTTSIGGLMRMQWHKWTTMDYQLMEDPDFKDAEAKANKAFGSNHAPAMNIVRNLVEFFANTMGFILYALVISSVHPVILLVLLFSAAISWVVLLRARRYDEKTRGERSSLWKRLTALNDKMREPEAAKDFRLYSLSGWLKSVYDGQHAAVIGAERKVATRNLYGQLTDAALILLRDGAAYGLLIWFVLEGRISLGTFVYVFAAIGALAGWITGILKAAGDLFKAGIEMNDIKTLFEYPDISNRGEGIPLPDTSKAPPLIQLKNVGYTYPKAEKPTLSGVNVTLNPGESLAIVGANGAGKTTLVKLLCGLYQPTAGEVLAAGNPSTAYNRDDFFTLFSAVFQDIHFTANSIAENISQQLLENTDMERVRYCLDLVGLADKIDTLPQKEHTLLIRSVNADAVELSGGEKQKLAMARAVYKDAPIVILDEPTAALDPIAENEVYHKYAQLTRGKSSIFISHRLASTRFCDRILLIDKGGIAESGNHDQLMAQGGIYANMFNIQASYYQDKGETAI